MKYLIALFLALSLSACDNNIPVGRADQSAPRRPALQIKAPESDSATLSVIVTPGNLHNLVYGTIMIDGCKYVFLDLNLVHAGNCPNHGNIRAEKQ